MQGDISYIDGSSINFRFGEVKSAANLPQVKKAVKQLIYSMVYIISICKYIKPDIPIKCFGKIYLRTGSSPSQEQKTEEYVNTSLNNFLSKYILSNNDSLNGISIDVEYL